jgi:hypothetical protein
MSFEFTFLTTIFKCNYSPITIYYTSQLFDSLERDEERALEEYKKYFFTFSSDSFGR